MASSVERLGWYANYNASRVPVNEEVSDHPFRALHHRATGQWSLRQVCWGFFGSGTIMFCLKYMGITDCAREGLNMSVNTGSSWCKL